MSPSLSHSLWVSLSAGAALFFHGCGGSSTSSKRTSVIVMRHCVRSALEHLIFAKPGLREYNDYSAEKWPEFPAGPMFCLPRGKEILKAQGSWTKANGGLPLPLRAIADNTGDDGQRDNVTMTMFLDGLALDAKDVTTSLDHLPFGCSNSKDCNAARGSDEAMKKEVLDFIDANPPPPGYSTALQRVYEAVGEGSAGNWTGIPCAGGTVIGQAWPIGACEAASFIMERFLMEWGGGLEIAWGKMNASELSSLMVLHNWWFYVWGHTPANYRGAGASILRHVSARLTEAEVGTTLYIGHDLDIARFFGALDLTWDAVPFGLNETLPGSMLRFDLEDDTVTASYIYVENFSNTDGAMKTVPAHFSESSNKISLTAFQDMIEKNTIAACANSYSGATSKSASPTASIFM